MNGIDSVLAEFRKWAAVENLQLGEIEVESLGVPHRPTPLRTGCQGVYMFRLGEVWLKVGKAGPHSLARWTSHHYGVTRAMSTLAWSLFQYGHVSTFEHPDLPQGLRPQLKSVHPDAIGDWIKQHTARLNITIRAELGALALDRLESIARDVLHPVFEGRWDPSARQQRG